MDSIIQMDLSAEQIAAFCQRWHITELALFGSVLRDDFRRDSDVDVLVTFEPDAAFSLAGWNTMHQELEAMFGRSVDVIDRQSLERSLNYIRRREILTSARTIYAT